MLPLSNRLSILIDSLISYSRSIANYKTALKCQGGPALLQPGRCSWVWHTEGGQAGMSSSICSAAGMPFKRMPHPCPRLLQKAQSRCWATGLHFRYFRPAAWTGWPLRGPQVGLWQQCLGAPALVAQAAPAEMHQASAHQQPCPSRCRPQTGAQALQAVAAGYPAALEGRSSGMLCFSQGRDNSSI